MKKLIAFLLGIALVLPLAASAAPKISDFSCAGLRLGQTEQAVRDVLGKPYYTDAEIVYGCPVLYLAYKDLFVGISQRTQRVVDIKSYNEKYALNDNLINFGDTAYKVSKVLGKEPLTFIGGKQCMIYDLGGPRHLLLQIDGQTHAVNGLRLTELPLDSKMMKDSAYADLAVKRSFADADIDLSALLQGKKVMPKLKITLQN